MRKLVMSQALTSNLRSCSRCGAEFKSFTLARACNICKVPPTTYPRKVPTVREHQVVGLVAMAKTNKEIAAELHLSEGTIKEYLFHIFKKVGVTNRGELMLWSIARERELQATVAS